MEPSLSPQPSLSPRSRGDTLLLKISFPDGIPGAGGVTLGQDYKFLRFDPGETVRSAIQLIAERTNYALEGGSYGLFVPPTTDKMGGVWLQDERTMGSYGLKDQDTVSFKGRARTIKILVDEHQTLVPVVVDYTMLVEKVIQVVLDSLHMKGSRDDYVLKDTSQPDNRGFELKKPLLAQMGPGSLLLKRKTKARKFKAKAEAYEATYGNQMFGVPLLVAIHNSGARAALPLVCFKCIEYIETRALDVEGIFRMSGSNVEIQNLKARFDKGEDVDMSQVSDPHVVAGLLKLYFRELPEPLITFQLYDYFIAAHGLGKAAQKLRLRCMQALLQYLPDSNRVLLHRLLQFLNVLIAHREHNKMAAPNLAIVFAPNIMRQREESIVGIIKDAGMVNSVIKTLIEEFDAVFEACPDDAPAIARGSTAHVASTPEEISVSVNDVVFVTGMEPSGKLIGVCNNRFGSLPANAVTVLSSDDSTAVPRSILHTQATLSPYSAARKMAGMDIDPMLLDTPGNARDAELLARMRSQIDDLTQRLATETARREAAERDVARYKHWMMILGANPDELDIPEPTASPDMRGGGRRARVKGGPKEGGKEEAPKREEPKEPKETPKEEAPKEETPKEETPKEETPKEAPKEEAPKEETPKEETPKEAPKEETPKEAPKEEAPKEAPKEETPKEETPKEETPKEETPKEAPKEETPKEETPKETPKEAPKDETPKQEEHKEETPKEEAPKDAPKDETPKQEEHKEPKETPNEAPKEEAPNEAPKSQDDEWHQGPPGSERSVQ